MSFLKKSGTPRETRITEVTDDGGKPRSWGRPGQTIVGSHTRIRGTLKGSGPLVIQGSIEGEIDLKGTLIVPVGGCVDAEADVHSLELSGRASGSMRVADHVHISSTGMFEGDMATPVIETHSGSVLRGKALITKRSRLMTDD